MQLCHIHFNQKIPRKKSRPCKHIFSSASSLWPKSMKFTDDANWKKIISCYLDKLHQAETFSKLEFQQCLDRLLKFKYHVQAGHGIKWNGRWFFRIPYWQFFFILFPFHIKNLPFHIPFHTKFSSIFHSKLPYQKNFLTGSNSTYILLLRNVVSNQKWRCAKQYKHAITSIWYVHCTWFDA